MKYLLLIITTQISFFTSHVSRFFRRNGRVNVPRVVLDPGFETADVILVLTQRNQDAAASKNKYFTTLHIYDPHTSFYDYHNAQFGIFCCNTEFACIYCNA